MQSHARKARAKALGVHNTFEERGGGLQNTMQQGITPTARPATPKPCRRRPATCESRSSTNNGQVAEHGLYKLSQAYSSL